MRLVRTVAAAVVALLLSATARTAGAATAPVRAPGETVTLPVGDVLARLPICAEDRTGYERSKLKHWADADHDGCNTRQEVLEAEAVVAPVQGANWPLTGGRWYSPYDACYIEGARGLDIDHLVPLAEARDSGAYG